MKQLSFLSSLGWLFCLHGLLNMVKKWYTGTVYPKFMLDVYISYSIYLDQDFVDEIMCFQL